MPALNAAELDPLDFWFARSAGAESIQLRTVTYAGGKFVAGGAGAVLTSPDGATWSRHALPPTSYVFGLAHNGNLYAAATIEGLVYSSPDATNWTLRATHTRGELWSIAYGNDVFVAVGSYAPPGLGYKPASLTSTDGLEWTRQEIDGPGAPLLSVAFGDGTFVATGANGAIYTSTNGVQWTLRPSPIAWSLHGLAYGNGTFVATSGNVALVSKDKGETWSTNAMARPESVFNEAGYAGGTFVAVGFQGDRLATSPDGVHWTARIPGSTDVLLGVAYDGARVVVVGSSVLQSAPLVPAPPLILRQPASRVVRAGSTYTNEVIAETITPVTYQWRKDGLDLPGATNAILVVSNAPLSLSGEHTVVVTGAGGSTTSAGASVRIAEPVAIVVQPVSQSVPQGGTAVFSIEATGTPPISFRWRRDGRTTNHVVTDGHVAFLAVTDAQDGADYTVAVSNIVTYPGVLSAIARLTVVPDTDGDGLPDSFESSHGLDPADPYDGALDADGDGLDNAAEYGAGTDPADPASFLKVGRIDAAGGARIGFVSQAGKTYAVEYSDNLGSGVWQRLAQLPARPVSQDEVVLDPSPASTRFYRLVTPAVP